MLNQRKLSLGTTGFARELEMREPFRLNSGLEKICGLMLLIKEKNNTIIKKKWMYLFRLILFNE